MVDRLLGNFVVSYNAGPYIKNVHTEYVQSHPADQIPVNDLKRAIHAAFPALAGQAGPRSLKRKGSVPSLSSSLNATPVGLPQLDGSNAADESPRLDPARDEQSSGNTTIKPHTKQRLAMAGHGGDRLSASQPWSERSRSRPTVLLPILAMKANPSTEAEYSREIETPTNSFAKVSRQAASMPNSKSTDRQEDIDRDPHREDRRASPPSSVFTDFASAWKSLAPGGAFAQQQPDIVPDQRRRGRRPMDLLGKKEGMKEGEGTVFSPVSVVLALWCLFRLVLKALAVDSKLARGSFRRNDCSIILLRSCMRAWVTHLESDRLPRVTFLPHRETVHPWSHHPNVLLSLFLLCIDRAFFVV
ncbi:hypothetical protein KC360_g17 [Hortaea werneckii]|nr:hypothetical protein KC344_g16 [Hortaea werneckii]KAI7180518.1 hypothetical protein KC360_g17 [Hortaea werneckii]